jgi:hypothetical protein
MGNQQSAQASRAIADHPSFLQLPYEIRCNMYRDACGGVISRQRFNDRDLETWNRGVQFPIPKRLLHISKEVSADVLSVFWSENSFYLRNAGFVALLQLGNPIMWSSLRDLKVELSFKNLPSNSRYWRLVCINLGAHLPPSQLTLDLHIEECTGFNAGIAYVEKGGD